jgi:hypothetical protein
MQRSVLNGKEHAISQLPSDPFSLQSRVCSGNNPLDLTSAITHQLQRSNDQQALQAWQQQLEATQMYMSHKAPVTPSMMPGINDLSPVQQSCITGILPEYIPHFNSSMKLGVAGSRVLNQLPVSLGRADSQHGFTGDVALPGASDFGGRWYHDQQAIMTPARVTEIQGMHNGLSTGPYLPWAEQQMLGYGASEAAAGAQGQRTDTGGSCVMSVTGELSSHVSSGMHRSQRSTRSLSLIGDQLCQDAELCTDDDDLESVLIDDKRKKRMNSNRASAQRSRQRRQERLDQLEVLTAQLRVENATIVRKANLATQLAKKFEEEKDQLQVKLQKLKRVLDKVGGSKLLKQLAEILDTEDFSSSRQMSVAHMVQRQSPSPDRKQQESTDDKDSEPCGSGNKRGSITSGDSSGERQELGRSYTGHRHPDDSNFQPSTLEKLLSVQPNNHVSDVVESSSRRRKRRFSNGQTKTPESPPQSNTTSSDSQMEQNASEIYHQDIFLQFDSMAQMFPPDHLHSSSHMTSSGGVQSFESEFDTTEGDKWLENFAYSLHSEVF